ncbi:SET domain-containing protein [Confluentibacter lentus]|uniref:SET domain-containing protein n=1 Tax=Confluentibacter lentus TaxID=1699412 RepID=UPI000C28151F|nr:SET domain-containing protein [Confluentibacter lentus]
MIHPHTEVRYINNTIGYGVFATKLIPAGTITWALDKLDREFSKKEFESMEPIYQEILETYTYRNNLGKLILCWDNGRYVNHSFNSNCLTTAYDFEIAIRDIQAGEELTDDYGYLNISKPFEGIDESTERKIVYPDDLLKYHKEWDEKISNVFNKITSLEQPLKQIIPTKVWDKINKVIEGKEMLDSIICNYYDENKENQLEINS